MTNEKLVDELAREIMTHIHLTAQTFTPTPDNFGDAPDWAVFINGFEKYWVWSQTTFAYNWGDTLVCYPTGTVEVWTPEQVAAQDAWQPIETAPPDEGITIYSGGRCWFGCELCSDGWVDVAGSDVVVGATHWQPHPTPPRKLKEAEQGI